MIERRKLTTLDKLKVVVAQARCPLCNERLGDLEGLDFDHSTPLALGGVDAVENLQAVHRSCHKVKTAGPATTAAGGDVHKIAKTRRLAKREQEFRARLLTAPERTAVPAYMPADHADRPKTRWPKRPFPKRSKPS
jgi:5-methylcytosine-specific restriction endonuclease McrA